MEQSSECANLFVSGATGPLAIHLDAYVACMVRNQYATSCIRIKVLHALAFDRWLEQHGIAIGKLNESHISGYQHRRSHRFGSRNVETRRRELFDLEHLLDFLRQQGVCAFPPTAQQTPIDSIASDFERHLRFERGLANETVCQYTTAARHFMADRFGGGLVFNCIS